jgi:hypothetical protein
VSIEEVSLVRPFRMSFGVPEASDDWRTWLLELARRYRAHARPDVGGGGDFPREIGRASGDRCRTPWS